MKRLRLPLVHPLAEVFFAAVRSVTTSMSDSTKGRYRTTTEYFLRYLGEHHPGVRTLDQLKRDPHILGWLTWLCSQQPPLVKATRSLHVLSLRRVMEELAWLHEIPALLRLFHPDDVPQPAARFPRPLTPEQDRLVQQEFLRRNDVASNALLLIRHTGMRISPLTVSAPSRLDNGRSTCRWASSTLSVSCRSTTPSVIWSIVCASSDF